MCICACARPYPQVVVVGCLQLLQLLGQLCALEAEVHGTLQASIAVQHNLVGEAAQSLGNILERKGGGRGRGGIREFGVGVF